MTHYFEDNAIEMLGKQIETYKSEEKSLFIMCDDNTAKHCLSLLYSYYHFDFLHHTITVRVGEETKNIKALSHIYKMLSSCGANRNSILFCLGGGVVCDIGGFVAATFMRGIDCVLIPTSLTAQIDASIGGKNAVNLDTTKNLVGVFRQPDAIFTIPEFLETLPEKEIFSGFAEMLKHGLIADKTYWKKLIKITNSSQIIDTELIKKSIQIKTAICDRDPYEKNERKKLNFGHTIGHALESLALDNNYKLSHGEAVALGMMTETHISYQKNMIREEDFKSITKSLQKFFQPFDIDRKNYNSIFYYLHKDKKNDNNGLNFTLLDGIGSAVINQYASREEIISALENTFSSVK